MTKKIEEIQINKFIDLIRKFKNNEFISGENNNV